MSKSARFTAMAVKHYIAVLETALAHCCEDEGSSLENDITLYRGLIPILESGKWPENPKTEGAQ